MQEVEGKKALHYFKLPSLGQRVLPCMSLRDSGAAASVDIAQVRVHLGAVNDLVTLTNTTEIRTANAAT